MLGATKKIRVLYYHTPGRVYCHLSRTGGLFIAFCSSNAFAKRPPVSKWRKPASAINWLSLVSFLELSSTGFCGKSQAFSRNAVDSVECRKLASTTSGTDRRWIPSVVRSSRVTVTWASSTTNISLLIGSPPSQPAECSAESARRKKAEGLYIRPLDGFLSSV